MLLAPISFWGKDWELEQNGECGGEELRCQVCGEPSGSDGRGQGRRWETHDVYEHTVGTSSGMYVHTVGAAFSV